MAPNQSASNMHRIFMRSQHHNNEKMPEQKPPSLLKKLGRLLSVSSLVSNHSNNSNRGPETENEPGPESNGIWSASENSYSSEVLGNPTMRGARNDETPPTTRETTPETMHSQPDFAASVSDLTRPPKVYSQGHRHHASNSGSEPSTSTSSTLFQTQTRATSQLRPSQSGSSLRQTQTQHSTHPSTSNTTRSSKSQPKLRHKKGSIAPPPPPTQFELTPLSSLITQSFNDLRTLKRLHTRKLRTPSFGSHDMQTQIDFEKIEQRLKGFEELYKQYLRYGGDYGGECEEVCLVAMVCRRGEVVKGVQEVGVAGKGVVPMRKVADCYM